jgi:1,2-phenylacetyl-CoA epoxidase PaaB subunit
VVARGVAERAYYEVFARHEDGEPIRHVGSVSATNPKDARVFAFTLYDEFRWKEMFVAPRAMIVPVIRPA